MSKLEEGIHLIAYVTDKKSGESTTIEDYDYNSKKQFRQELENNGYKIISILDNRDMFLLDNTNYTRVSQIQKELRQLKKDIEDSKDKYPALHKSYINDYNSLKDIYDKVMKISLTEGYVLKGIQDGKSFDISYNDNEEKLQKFKDEMQPRHKDIDMYIVRENKKIKPGTMKKLNIGGDGIVYKVSTQDAAKLQNAGYEIFLPQGSRKSLYARLGDIEDYNNGYDVNGNKLEEDKNNSIILYHGSPNKNITSLQIGVKDTTGDQYGRGIYLTSDYNEAKGYAGSDGKVYKVQLDSNINLYNMKDKLSDSIKEQVKKELSNSDNKDVKNYLVMFGRKVYRVTDKQEGLKFFKEKEQEWKNKDNKYFGNRPKVSRTDKELEVIYTDYNDMDNAINNMTGDNLLDVFSGDVNPEVFATIIKDSGYDGVISLSGKWYVIYKNIDKVHILNENKKLKNKNKLEEVSRNELLVKTKGETITRYNKAASYKGFNIVNIYTDNLFKDNTLTIVLRVGKYNDVIQLEDVLYWIQIVAENKQGRQINTKGITEALMNAIDGMDIKIDCECRRFPL